MNGDSSIREGVPMRTNTAKGTRAIAACGACALAVAMTGCGASFEGSGSKDAASAEQLAMHADDPWAVEIGANSKAQSDFTLVDGVYTSPCFWAKKQAVGKSDHLLISIYIFTNPFSYSFCKLIRIPVFAWNHVSPPWK